MSRPILVDARAHGDAVERAMRTGLERLASSEPPADVEYSGSRFVAKADFRLYTVHLQEWPQDGPPEKRLADALAVILDPSTRWIGRDEAVEHGRRIAAAAREAGLLLEERGFDPEFGSFDPGGGWTSPTISSRHHLHVLPDDAEAIAAHVVADLPRVLWIRREKGRRKWNLRIGGESAMTPSCPDADAIERMRAIRRFAGADA